MGEPGLNRTEALTEDDQRVWEMHAVRHWSQVRIAAELGVSQQSVSARLANIRAKLPPVDLEAARAALLEMYRDTLERAHSLAEMPGAPVTAGKDGDVVRDPEHDEAVVRDYALRVQALKLKADTAAHLRKLLGLDAAEKLELSGAVRYELVGIDPEDLS